MCIENLAGLKIYGKLKFMKTITENEDRGFNWNIVYHRKQKKKKKFLLNWLSPQSPYEGISAEFNLCEVSYERV